MDPRGKRVVVTGGGSGIGLAVARAFQNNEHEVTICGRDEARLQETGLPYVKMDVADERSVIEGVKRCGSIDIFVASAGGAETSPALKISRAIWDRMIALNLTSVYLCAREAAPQMVERGWGRFIAIASTAALKGYSYAGAYAAAKHGVLGWVRTLAIELAKTGVTANAICPGYSDTPLLAHAVDAIVQKTGRTREEAAMAFARNNPMGRLIKPNEVAAVALWLASDSAASITGQAIPIDGGDGGMTDDRDALRAWLELLAAANDLKKSIDAKLRDSFGISISRFDVLAALDRSHPEGLRAGILSSRLKVTQGNTTQVTAPLVRDGLVCRTVSQVDGRVAIFRLTRKGRRLFSEIAERHRIWVAEAFSGLGSEQLAAFRTLVGKLRVPVEFADARKDAA